MLTRILATISALLALAGPSLATGITYPAAGASIVTGTSVTCADNGSSVGAQFWDLYLGAGVTSGTPVAATSMGATPTFVMPHVTANTSYTLVCNIQYDPNPPDNETITVTPAASVSFSGSWSSTLVVGTPATFTYAITGANANSTWLYSNGTTAIPGLGTVGSPTAEPASGTFTFTPTVAGSYSITEQGAVSGQTYTTGYAMTVAASSGSGGGTGSNGASAGCLGSSAGCGSGTSTFTNPFTFTIPTTLPTVIPSNFTPVLAPSDLSIGIPGIGSFTFPTGWWTQIISFAVQWANISTGLTGPVLTTAINTSANSITSNLVGAINASTNSIDAQIVSALPPLEQSTAAAGTQVATATFNAGSAVQTQIQNTETRSVTDFQGMLSQLLNDLFAPNAQDDLMFENLEGQFLNWGPYTFVQSIQLALNPPAGDGSLGGMTLGIPNYQVNAGQTPLYVASAGGNVQVVSPGSWYVGGNGPSAYNTIPFDTTTITNCAGWPIFRAFLGAAVWLAFGSGCLALLTPKQVF